MKASRHFFLLFGQMVLLINLLSISPAYGASDSASVAALVGLKEFYLRVDMSDAQSAQKGVITKRLQHDTEKQLRRAGINLLSKQDYDRLKQSRYYPLARLDILVTMNEIERFDLYMFHTTVQVMQVVFLSRKPLVKMVVPTWEKRAVGFDSDPGAVQTKVRILVGKFIDAYHLANPR